jgi:hypothetical protein
MDIFIIEISNVEKVKSETLKQFQKKDISDEKKLKEHCLAYLLVDKFLDEVYNIKSREIIFEDGKPILIMVANIFQ